MEPRMTRQPTRTLSPSPAPAEAHTFTPEAQATREAPAKENQVALGPRVDQGSTTCSRSRVLAGKALLSCCCGR